MNQKSIFIACLFYDFTLTQRNYSFFLPISQNYCNLQANLKKQIIKMRNFTTVNDIGNLQDAVKEALEVKANRFAYKHLGENKTLLMIFFNSSLRTRLSTQKAALNLGMNVIVLDVNQGAWKLET
jgi:aspartate carbamoyltransferase catalytic subunit